MSGFKSDLTPVQAEALKVFQARLDNDIRTLKEDNKSIILWGVGLVPDAPKVDVILLKFLRARDFKVEEAALLLINCIKWRKEFGIDRIFEEQYPDAITSLGYIHKTDKQGRPVMYNTYGNINIKEAFDDQGGIDKFVRWRVQLMEKAILRLDMDSVEDMVVVHDYQGASFLKIDKNMKLVSRTLIALFQENYPELLARKFFVNIPWFFETVFTMVSAFTSDRTKAKFVVCSKSSLREKLLANIPVENLPTDYGGLSQLDMKPATSATTDAPESSPPPPVYTSTEKAIEVVIEAGAKYEIVKEVETGATLVWEFTLLTSDVLFTVHFVRTTGNLTPVDVFPARRLEQHAGVHSVSESGKYVLTWDNSSAFFAKRKLYYKVFVADVTTEEATSPSTDASTLD